MPYIKQERRTELIDLGFKSGLEGNAFPRNAGELNYQITSVIKAYLVAEGKSYQTINDIVGALEGAKLEFYRRVAAKYEDEAIERNGDIY